MSFVLLRDLVRGFLGNPPKPEGARPNQEGGATPHYPWLLEGEVPPAGAVALYRVVARCAPGWFHSQYFGRLRGCGQLYRHWSFQPQYDDEDIPQRICDACVSRHETGRAQREEQAELLPARTTYRSAAPVAEPEEP